MRLAKILFTAILLIMTSVALADESVEIVVPNEEGTVNANGFTLIAKARGEFDTYQYRVQIVVFNERNADLQDAYVFPTGVFYSGGPYLIEIVQPTPDDVSGTNPISDDGVLPIVVRMRNFIKDDPYYLYVGLSQWPSGPGAGDWVFVQTR